MAKLQIGINDLATVRPDLASEWDYEKNELKPYEVTCGVNKKVWWICKKGHSYEAKIGTRTSYNTGCPYCSRHTLLQGYNDLATTDPHLLNEWDFEKNVIEPTKIMRGSNKKVWWICKKGHSYEATPNKRTGINAGCPVCAGRQVIQGVNDLATVYQDLIKEWDFGKNKIKPTDVTFGSGKKVWWVCKKGHSYEAIIENRTKGYGCPICAGKEVLEGFNDLKTVHPEIACEWDANKNSLKPTEVTFGSNKVVWWECSKGHSYQQCINDKVIRNLGCPICAGKEVLEGYNDLKTLRPDIACEWDMDKNSLKPTEVTCNSGKKVWWKCSKGHSYETVIDIKVRRESSCPICVGKKVLSGFNDLATKCPELIKEWDFSKNSIKPTELTSGSSKRVWWLCSKGHSYEAKVADRVSRNTGCPICKSSGFEQLVYKMLDKYNIKYEYEYTPKNLSFNGRYDIYLEEASILIELDGGQHFKNVTFGVNNVSEVEGVSRRDNIKTQYAYDNNLCLLRIPYTYQNNYIKLAETILTFIRTKIVPQDIIDFYNQYAFNNYASVAKRQNIRIKVLNDDKNSSDN